MHKFTTSDLGTSSPPGGKFERLNRLIFKDLLQASNAAVWLTGDRLDRGLKVLELLKQGWVRLVVISGNDVLVGRKRPGENNISLDRHVSWLKNKGVKPRQIIMDRKSFNTRDQAVNVITLAKSKGWKSLVIVGSSYGQFRSFLTFLKAAQELEYKGRIINQFAVIPDSRKPGGRQQTAGELKKLEIAKLKKYKRHLASLQEGIVYLNAYRKKN